MADSDLETAFQRAAEIAAKLPQNLQELGFTRALDAILAVRPKEPLGKVKQRAAPLQAGAKPVSTELLNAMDRTKNPDVGATMRVADQALKVLQIANNDHDVDGLSAQEISEILSKEFRLRASGPAVRMALSREVGTVDIRQRDDGTQVFHLMAPGEEYLATLRTGSAPRRKSPSRRGRQQRKQPVEGEAPDEKPPTTKTTPKEVPSPGRGGRPGPKAALSDLIARDFFSTAKDISEVQAELKHNRGHTYTVQELAPALVRSIRAGTLSRHRNPSGQYEYIAA